MFRVRRRAKSQNGVQQYRRAWMGPSKTYRKMISSRTLSEWSFVFFIMPPPGYWNPALGPPPPQCRGIEVGVSRETSCKIPKSRSTVSQFVNGTFKNSSKVISYFLQCCPLSHKKLGQFHTCPFSVCIFDIFWGLHVRISTLSIKMVSFLQKC